MSEGGLPSPLNSFYHAHLQPAGVAFWFGSLSYHGSLRRCAGREGRVFTLPSPRKHSLQGKTVRLDGLHHPIPQEAFPVRPPNSEACNIQKEASPTACSKCKARAG